MKRLQQWLKNMVILNPGLKFLALVMAIFTFHSIRGVTSDEAVHIAPVEAHSTDSDLEVIEQEPLSVSITLRGSREDLKKVDASDLVATLKLRNRHAGEHITPIRPRHIRGASGVRVANIEPDRAKITLAPVEPIPADEPATQEPAAPAAIETVAWTHVPVTVVNGDPAATGFDTAPADVNVTLTGPRKTLAAFLPGPPAATVDALEPGEPEGSPRPVQVPGADGADLTATIRPATVKVFRRHEEGN